MKNILIYNEDGDVRRQMAGVLRERGFQVFEAETGELAHVLIDSINFDLVVSDSCQNGGLNGFGVLVHSFRVNRSGARLLVSETVSDNVIRTAEYISSRCLGRPIEAEKFLSIVQVLMRQAAA